jgi:Holliday junction DNA helicase RuvA
MIATLQGTLSFIGTAEAIITVNGVGYLFQATSRTLAQLGEVGADVTILTDTQIKDDRLVLTGFADPAEKETYTLLQTVQGVGTKAALAILSALSPDDVVLAISAADKAMISRAEGVGPKLAQRVINELADKVAGVSIGGAAAPAHGQSQSGTANVAINDTVSALVNLGYDRVEAHGAAVRLAAESKADTVEALLPLTLKELGR